MNSESPQRMSMKKESASWKDRLHTYRNVIKGDENGKIDLAVLRNFSFQGIPDELRSIYWKVLLNFLPLDRNKWDDVLKESRKIYQDWKDELLIDPRKNESHDDHPLSTSQGSRWRAFFKDNEIIEEVDKDVKRTLPHLHFFNHDKKVGSTQHYEALKQILFIYAKLNPGIKYVQGMNEILGPIYYIFATDPEPSFREHAEADTFFCFTNLMSEIRDNFCKILDRDASLGIMSRIKQMNDLLKEKDAELWQDFEDKALNPQFYSFRWLTLLLSQEFELPDVLRIWDSLFADESRFEYLLYVCCAMLVILRDTLLDGSFADNLKLLQVTFAEIVKSNVMLQNYPEQDIYVILQKAKELQDPFYQPPSPRPKLSPANSKDTGRPRQASFSTVVQTSSIQTTTTQIITQKKSSHEEDDSWLHEENLANRTVYIPHVPVPFDELEDNDDENSKTYKNHPLE